MRKERFFDDRCFVVSERLVFLPSRIYLSILASWKKAVSTTLFDIDYVSTIASYTEDIRYE